LFLFTHSSSAYYIIIIIIITYEIKTDILFHDLTALISALRGRVYLPQDELAQFGLCDKDVFSRNVSERWRKFMKHQITRARFYFNRAEEGVSQLEKASRWPVGKPTYYYIGILKA